MDGILIFGHTCCLIIKKLSFKDPIHPSFPYYYKVLLKKLYFQLFSSNHRYKFLTQYLIEKTVDVGFFNTKL